MSAELLATLVEVCIAGMGVLLMVAIGLIYDMVTYRE